MASKLGTVVTCDDCSETEVWTNAIAALAVDGDTVILPSTGGTPAHWSSQHILNKAITLQGAGIDTTVILNDFSGAYWIRFDLQDNKITTVTGITFKNGSSTGSGNINSNSVLRFIGSSTSSYQLRVHHCKFESLLQWPIFCGQVKGVFDHNIWFNTQGGGAYIYGLNWRAETPTGTEDFGDGSWAYPTNPGTGDAVYFENNLFDQTGSPYNLPFFDGTRGGRGVIRYNTFTKPTGNAAIIHFHGLENRNRSIRHVEVYNNYMTSVLGNVIQYRGGTMVAFNNRVASGAAGGTQFGFQQDREGDPTFWGRASGSNPSDVNDPNGGTNSAPIPFYTGVMGGTTTTDFIQVVPSPNWTPVNKWVGYSVSDLDIIWPSTGQHFHQEVQYAGGPITASTADTITTAASTYGNSHAYANGHDFIIKRCLHAMDMIGRAGTSDDSLVTGGANIANPPIFPPGWNNEALEPLFEWNNIKGASTDINFGSAQRPQIREGVHYYNNTVPVTPEAAWDYPWTANVETICGAEDYTNVTLPATAANGKGGFLYPHPLVEAPTGSKIIDVPTNYNFGNVIIGEVGTYSIPVHNAGDTSLTVSDVSFTSPYEVASPLNFTVGPGATVNKVATFTPSAETTYNDEIVFASDTDGDFPGNDTLAVTGVGVAPAGGGGRGKGHKKGVLVQRGR